MTYADYLLNKEYYHQLLKETSDENLKNQIKENILKDMEINAMLTDLRKRKVKERK